MSSNQGDRQATVEASTGTAYGYNGDWHALFDQAGIAAGDFNGRMLQWINTQLSSSYPDINGAQNAYAVSQSVATWDSLGSFSIGIILSNRSIAENSANGTTLGTASLPPSFTGTKTWSLTDALGVFQINSATGVVTVLSNANLNFETHPTIPITISVSGVSPAASPSNISVTVTNVIETPVNTVLPAITGAAIVGNTLSVSTGTWTDMAGPGAATFAYQWKRGVTNVGTNSSTYTLVHADDAAVMTCVVTATNTAGSGTPATSAGTSAVVEAPSNTVAPVISGTAASGSTLSTTNGTWQGDATITFTYQWKADGAAIGGATSSTFVLTNTQIGANITCVVTGTNSVGSATAASNSLGPVTAGAPVNTVAPIISGATSVGSTLTVTDNGTWSGAPTITYTYQWANDSGNIVGETGSTYVVASGDNGLLVYCKVTGTNGLGNSTANSNSIGPIGSSAAGATWPYLGF